MVLLLIFSWNVAGLSSTVHRIHALLQNGSASKDKKKNPLTDFFRRHQADIVCLQEHKIAHSQLLHRTEPLQCALGRSSRDNEDDEEDDVYESYWSCCVDPQYRGFNGVVTYVRQGNAATRVLAANGTCALGDAELDAQGRCVLTEHAAFLLFNVYVPCGGGRSTAAFSNKLKFLHALRRAMQRQRHEKQKPVLLVGDLNIGAYQKEDVHWKDRLVYFNDLQQQPQPQEKDLAKDELTGNDDDSNGNWRRDLVQYWPELRRILETTAEVVPVRTTNASTGQVFDKFRLTVRVPHAEEGRCIALGQPETSAEECRYDYTFTEQFYFDEATQSHRVLREANVIPVAILKELLEKLIFLPRQWPLWSDAVWYEIAESVGTVNRTSPTRGWLQSVLEEDGMVDAFRHFYPAARHRFTCWNQNKNHRYSNYGSRIDYTLIDRALLPYLEKGEDPTLQQHDQALPVQVEGAWRAATAAGQYQPAPYEKSGIMEAAPEVLETQFAVPPHTGHVYTPPTFSDHIAVSVLFREDMLPREAGKDPTETSIVEKRNDILTRKAQPHKQQPTIVSFFSSVKNAASSSSPGSPSSSSVSEGARESQHKRLKRLATDASRNKAPPPNSVLHHFRKKET